ncbi:RHS repeat domain-containing protein [uncultured Aquimarina sp.]|uniref:RHS repeat domain-containing protein n=1 Tax=uncultured Aquimarina sp. TaxID=575652 RepID=UPI0026273D4B|nr:RHS repeat domain-containing protein [uncultured Aquimarina sp.]
MFIQKYITTFLIIIGISCWAQDNQTNAGFDYVSELSRSIPTPLSPEAYAFMQYGQVPVNSYTGNLGYSLPLFTHTGAEMSLPMSLSYDQNIKVSQVATGAGLGWNLNLGGRISRVVNGLPDNGISGQTVFDADTRASLQNYYGQGGMFGSVSSAKDHYEWTKDIEKGRIDVHPDYFTLNALGINEVIAFDISGGMEAKVISNPRIQVELIGGFPSSSNQDIQGWIITGEDGSRYHFEMAEQTRKIGDDSSFNSYSLLQIYNSSWVLTKIESPNRADIYTFQYEQQPYSSEIVIAQEYEIASTTIKPNQVNHGIDNISSITPDISIKQLFLTSVSYNGRQIYDINLSDRYDYRQVNRTNNTYTSVQNVIDAIDIYQYNHKTNINDLVQSVDLQHSYFGPSALANNPQTVSNWDHLKIKLKLDVVAFKNADDLLNKKFGFEYYSPTAVPARNSKAQDYMGYYNGKNNTTLFPKIEENNLQIAGADRNPNAAVSNVGVLKKVIYPTGGYSIFNFENHQISKTLAADPITLEKVIVSGGTSTFDCRGLCRDKYIQPPKVQSKMLYIPESGKYDIKFTNSGSQLYDAWIIKRPNNTVVYDGFIGWGGGSLPNPSFSWFPNTTVGDYTDNNVYFASGYYQITIANKQEGTSVGIEVIDRRSQEYEVVTSTKPGLRLKSIANYDHNDTKLTSKEYQYDTGLGNGFSSGRELYKPSLVSYSSSKIFKANQGFIDTKTVVRKATAAGSPQNHIVYQKVYEYNRVLEDQYDGSTPPIGTPPDEGDILIEETDPDQPRLLSVPKNGYTITTYHTGRHGIVPDRLGNNYFSDYKIGKPKTIDVFDAYRRLRSSRAFTYEDYPVFSSPGLVFQLNEENKYLYKVYYNNSNGQVYEGTYPGNLSCFECSNDVVINEAAPPEICTSSNHPNRPANLADCNLDPKSATKQLIGRTINGRGGFLASEIVYNYYSNGSIKTSKNYTHDADIDYLLRSVELNNEATENLTIHYYYPKDYQLGNLPDLDIYNNEEKAGYDAMVDQNKISIPIRIERFKNTQKLSTVITSFKSFDGLGPLPYNVYQSKANNPFINRIKYQSYNNLAKPTKVLVNENLHKEIIYHPNNRWIIAQIENANPTISDDQADIPIANDIENLLPDLYADHPNAMITGYAYNSLGQLIKMIDPRGYNMTYHYDEFNRLKFVKDNDGNLVSENKYNYKN